jgi:hypothetical protein
MLALDRFCFPDPTKFKDFAIDIADRMSNGQGAKYVGDVYNAWEIIVIMCFVSALIAFIYLCTLRCFAKPLVFISLILILLLLIAGGAWLFKAKDNHPEGSNNFNAYKYGGIATLVVAGIYAIIIICCCSRIRKAIAIIEATSEFAWKTP